MKLNPREQIRKGGKVFYNDRRPGHQGVRAVVLEVDSRGMSVLFEDRANTNYILFSDSGRMDFISVVE